MVKRNPDLLRGTVDVLLLKALSAGPRHGFAVARWLEERTEDVLQIEEGSLYPALHRMEQAGWLKAVWGLTKKNRRARLYSVTAKGRRQLAEEQEHWDRLTVGVAKVLSYT